MNQKNNNTRLKFKIIENLLIERKLLTNIDLNEVITINSGDFIFNGVPILVKDEMAYVLEGNGSEIAVVLTDEDSLNNKKLNLIIFRDLNWSISEFIDVLDNDLYGADEILNHLESYYDVLTSFFNVETIRNIDKHSIKIGLKILEKDQVTNTLIKAIAKTVTDFSSHKLHNGYSFVGLLEGESIVSLNQSI